MSLLAAALLRATFATESQPYHWRNVEIVGGGFVSGILFHPRQKDLVYARTDIGGAYRLDPKTQRWVPLVDWLEPKDWNLTGIESMAVDLNDPRRLYLATGTYTNEWAGNGAVLRSTDQGRTFQRTDMPFKLGGNMPGRGIGEKLVVDPEHSNSVWLGSRNDGLWHSTDFGAHWTRASEVKGIGFLAFVGKRFYIGLTTGPNTLLQSDDRGASWTPTPNAPKLIPHHLAAFDGGVMITYSNNIGPNDVTDGAVWKLDPKTGAWTDITPVKPGGQDRFGYAGLGVDGRNPRVAVVSTLDRWSKGDGAFRTVDGGAHWRSLKENSIRDSSKAAFLRWDRMSADFGHWIAEIKIDPFNPDRAMYVTGATIWKTDDLTASDRGAATHWTVGAEGLEETAVDRLVSPPVGAQVISALGDIGGFEHFDITKSPATGIRRNPTISSTSCIDFAGLRPNQLVRVGRSNRGNGGYSGDQGKSWTPFGGRFSGGQVAISANGDAIVWAPSNAAMQVSRDHGATWTEVVGGARNCFVAADRVDPKLFYAVEEKGTNIFRSRDGGATFEKLATSAPANHGRLETSLELAGHVWLPSSAGLWR